jgi:hypothetical protein
MRAHLPRYSATPALVLILTASLSAQDKGEPISVHVREVNRIQDEEPTAEGTWFHITAVVESKTIIYSLKCDEYFSNEKHGFAASCFHLSAGKDYPGKTFPTAMGFWRPEDRSSGFTLVMYEIVSEKEK